MSESSHNQTHPHEAEHAHFHEATAADTPPADTHSHADLDETTPAAPAHSDPQEDEHGQAPALEKSRSGEAHGHSHQSEYADIDDGERGQTHEHPSGSFGWMQRIPLFHAHSHALETDRALESSERGIRCVQFSLIIL